MLVRPEVGTQPILAIHLNKKRLIIKLFNDRFDLQTQFEASAMTAMTEDNFIFVWLVR
nr:hypothetical protein [uncultured bacterium]